MDSDSDTSDWPPPSYSSEDPMSDTTTEWTISLDREDLVLMIESLVLKDEREKRVGLRDKYQHMAYTLGVVGATLIIMALLLSWHS